MVLGPYRATIYRIATKIPKILHQNKRPIDLTVNERGILATSRSGVANFEKDGVTHAFANNSFTNLVGKQLTRRAGGLRYLLIRNVELFTV